jgi:hypothetical protein
MAGQSTSEIVVGSNGDISAAAIGVAAPTNATTALASGWTNMGFLSENGATFTYSRTVEPIPVWQLFDPARRIVTGRDITLAFVMRQWNTATLRLAFGGGDVSGTPPNYVYEPPDPEDLDERQLCLDWVDGDREFRLYISHGMVTDNVETNIVRTAAADLPVTFAATPAAGTKPYKIFASDPAFSGYS